MKKQTAIPLLFFLLAIFLLLLMYGGTSREPDDVLASKVYRSDFEKVVIEAGELRAKHSTIITSPSIRGELKILFLAPKGAKVEQGDTLVVFDSTEVLSLIDTRMNDRQVASSDLEKAKTTSLSKVRDAQMQLENAKASFELAQLQMKQVEFEAEVIRQERELSLKKAKMELEKAEQNVEQERRVNAVEVRNAKLALDRAEQEYQKSLAQKDRLVITAPQRGLVVYKTLPRGMESGEIKPGDTVWRGMPLLEIPDLSTMEVISEISELDVGKVMVGQRVTVTPDAYPDRVFTGRVTEVARLAHQKRMSTVKVFDVIIELDSTDVILRPGMTVKSRIIVQQIADTLLIPLEALFYEEGHRIAYLPDDGMKPVAPTLGPSNGNSSVVISGISEGTLVSLNPPGKLRSPSGIARSQDSTAPGLDVQGNPSR